MILLAVYIVVTALGELAVYWLGLQIEAAYPEIGLTAYLTLFFMTLWLGWRVAIAVTPES